MEIKKVFKSLLFLAVIAAAQSSNARVVDQVMRMPAAGNIPSYGSIDLSKSAAVGSSILPAANGGTGLSSLGANVATFLGTPSSANLAAALTDETGTGAACFANSPTLVTPALGTPSALVGTNITGSAAAFNAGTATALAANPTDCGVGDFATAIDASGNLTCSTPAGSGDVSGPASSVDGEIALFDLTTGKLIKAATGSGFVKATSGVYSTQASVAIGSEVSGLGANVATFLGTPSSANLASALTDETGSGAAVFATSPALVTPDLGTPSALVGTNITGSGAGFNAGTATALAANPTDCGGGQFANAIAANGDLTCAAPAGAAGVTAIAALSIDWSLTPVYTKTLSANSTFTFTGASAGQTIIVRLTNTASNYTVTWPSVKWQSGAAPTMTIGAKDDIYTFVYDGSTYYGSYVQDMF